MSSEWGPNAPQYVPVAAGDGPSTSVPTREFGLHPGFPGHEVARLDTSTRQWMKLDRGDEPEGYAFKSLQKAPWFRSVMVPAPGLPEEGPPPVDEAADVVRGSGWVPRSPQHGIWDPSDGSVRGLRGKSLRRGATGELLRDYMRRQVGAGFVRGLEAPPPHVKRAISGDPRDGPLADWSEAGVLREGFRRALSGQLSVEAAAAGLKWAERTRLVNAAASAMESTDAHYDGEVTRRVEMKHMFFSHCKDEDGKGVPCKKKGDGTGSDTGTDNGDGDDSDDEQPKVELEPYERDEVEELTLQLRAERGIVGRWAEALTVWAKAGPPWDLEAGSGRWALELWQEDYCAGEAWAKAYADGGSSMELERRTSDDNGDSEETEASTGGGADEAAGGGAAPVPEWPKVAPLSPKANERLTEGGMEAIARARAEGRECPPSTTIDSYFEPLHARTAELPQPTDMTLEREAPPPRSLERYAANTSYATQVEASSSAAAAAAAAAKEEEEEEALLDTAALYIYEQLEHADRQRGDAAAPADLERRFGKFVKQAVDLKQAAAELKEKGVFEAQETAKGLSMISKMKMQKMKMEAKGGLSAISENMQAKLAEAKEKAQSTLKEKAALAAEQKGLAGPAVETGQGRPKTPSRISWMRRINCRRRRRICRQRPWITWQKCGAADCAEPAGIGRG